MKKLLLVLMSVLMLSACTKAPVSNTVPEETEKPQNVQSQQVKEKKIERTSDAVSTDGMTVLGETMINTDGGIADVYLMTSAQMGSDGYMLWDDSQKWKLVVADDEGSYPLFDSDIHGRAYIDVSESEKGAVISLIRISTVGMTVTKYTYRDGAFYAVDVLTAEQGGNNIYTSIPDYTEL